MSIYPTVRPSLTLDFQKSKQLDPRISFSRSSSATYVEGGVIKYADEHQSRFEKEGLLIEEARTNVSEYSVPSTANGWNQYEGTLTASATTAPDGTTTAATFIENTASSNNHRTNLDKFSGVSGTTYTSSVFVKAAGRTRFQLTRLGSSQVGTISAGSWGAEVDLAAGTITSTTTATSIQALANGWFRVSASYAMTGTTSNTNLLIYLKDDTGNRDYTGDGVSGIEVWGGQHEAGFFPTSYIPTTGSALTRSADVAQITGDNFSSWYNQSESTVVTKMTDNGEPNTTNNRDIYYLGTGASSGNNRIITTTGSVIGAYVQTTGAQVSITGGWYTKGVETVGAFAFKQDNFALATDGVIRGTDNSGDLPTCNRLYLFMNRNRTNTLNGHLARISYYTRRLTDFELQTITS